ncbi:MAG: hypothetical protein LBF76_00785, partial [Holosporales bacterium]|nr:hypothetical protein [Holosporales bacterium]
MKNFRWFCFGILAFLFSGAVSLLADEPPASAPKISLKMTCRAKGQELELCKKAVEDWKKHWKETKGQDCDVEVISLPPNSSDARTFTLQLLMGQSGDIDVCQVDMLWSAFLAPYVAPLDEAFPHEVQETYFPIAIQNNVIEGKLVAIPWYVDVDILFYRKDVLNIYGRPYVPQSWQYLIPHAKSLSSERERNFGDKILGYVFRGKSYEGLMCHVVEWIEAFGGHLFTPGTPPQQS